MTTALLLVDIQNDFLPGGALAVTDGDAVVPVANRLMPVFDCVVATQDWHPPHHLSFAAEHDGKQPFDVVDLDGLEQVLWPVHCVQHSAGASFASALDIGAIDHVVRKGSDARIDSYSAFYDNGHRKATCLVEWLRERDIDRVVVMGLAADVCVAYTVHDALAEGFDVWVVQDGVRGVNMQPDDTDRAIEAMRRAGAVMTDSTAMLRDR